MSSIRSSGLLSLLAALPLAAMAQPAIREPGIHAPAGSSVTVSTQALPGVGYRWHFNGYDLNRTGINLQVDNLQSAHAGLYGALPTDPGSAVPEPTIVSVATTEKVIGYGREIASDILHPNGRVYDQVLLDGAAVTVRADPGQTVRVSFLDLNDDIVQVEFTGAGNLSILLDQASGPALPVNYNQNVAYMKGHAAIVVGGADETTHLAIFSVGPVTAVNQALFKAGTVYDGVADLAFVAVQSHLGRFGGIRAANAHFFAARGHTGVYAPGIAFLGPVYLHAISAYDAATPVYLLGSGSDVRVTGGDLFQPNGKDVGVSGITQLKYMNGSDSHGVLLPAKANRARLVENGVDVTNQIVREVFTQQ